MVLYNHIVLYELGQLINISSSTNTFTGANNGSRALDPKGLGSCKDLKENSDEKNLEVLKIDFQVNSRV